MPLHSAVVMGTGLIGTSIALALGSTHTPMKVADSPLKRMSCS